MAEYLVSFLIGAASSAAVAYIFYRISRGDSKSLHRQAQLDSVSIRLKQLDPRSWRDNYRGHWGVDNMTHWLICMSELMREQGFEAGSVALTQIGEAMRQVCSGPNESSEITPEEAERTKKDWEKRILALSAIQPRSLLNRSKGG